MTKNTAPLIIIDTARYTVNALQANGNYSFAKLTPKEYGVLVYLAKARGTVKSREDLTTTIWGAEYLRRIDSRTIDQHIARLRVKLGRVAAGAITTIVNAGYKAEGVELRCASEIVGPVRKISGIFDKGKPWLDVTIRIKHTENVKEKQVLRLVGVNA